MTLQWWRWRFKLSTRIQNLKANENIDIMNSYTIIILISNPEWNSGIVRLLDGRITSILDDIAIYTKFMSWGII